MPRLAERDQKFEPFIESADAGVGVVYFIGHPDGQHIRIGYSADSKKNLARLFQHDIHPSGEPNRWLALVRGTKLDEAIIHKYFADALTAPSWYRRDAVLPYVTWLRDLAFVSTSEKEYYSAIGQQVYQGVFWLPGPERVSSRRTERTLLAEMDPWGDLPDRRITGDDYYTPAEILDIAREALGEIDLDPASHVQANALVRAKAIYTDAQNGLIQPWGGRVWLNPPFSKWALFSAKTLAELENLEAIVLLAATRTMTANYFAELLQRVDAIGVLTGRYAFWGITDASMPPDGHFLMYCGPDVARFVTAVGDKGSVFLNHRAVKP